jgi:hypothetical protein
LSKVKLARSFFSDLLDFVAQVARFDCIANRNAEFFEVDRFSNEVVSAAAESRDRVIDLDVACDHDHNRLRTLTFDLS